LRIAGRHLLAADHRLISAHLRDGVRSDADGNFRDGAVLNVLARIALVSAINMVALGRVGKLGDVDGRMRSSTSTNAIKDRLSLPLVQHRAKCRQRNQSATGWNASQPQHCFEQNTEQEAQGGNRRGGGMRDQTIFHLRPVLDQYRPEQRHECRGNPAVLFDRSIFL
jgi:hypothetical protein